MSNKTQLQTNNNQLDALITRVNAAKDTAASLPDAGGGSGGVETYDLIIQSDGVTKPTVLSYICYANGSYEYHSDGWSSTETYPKTFSNLVLRCPVEIAFKGGASPMAQLISNIDYLSPTDYADAFGGTTHHFGTSGKMFPLTSDNGQIIVSLYDDD